VLTVGTRRVQLIGLDLRWFRSPWLPTDQRGAAGKERYLPDADPAKTMLGEAQWRWLEAQLRTPADVRLLVSSIQCVVEGHGWERWGNLPAERDRLFHLMRDTGARGVLILSGDRHIGGIYREPNASVPYPVYELTSSGVTHPWATAAEVGPRAAGDGAALRPGGHRLRGAHHHTRTARRQQPGSVSKVEMATSMTLIYKVLFPAISTFDTPPYRRSTRVRKAARSWNCTVRIMGRDRLERLRLPSQVYWVRCAVDTSHTTPRSQGREQSGKSAVLPD
jgi:PhoD-like phosphatase